MPGDKIFVDTNILVYAYDHSAGKKHEKAKQIILELWNSGQGIVSTQVLQEFFVTVTQKIPKPMETKLAHEIIDDLLAWTVIINDGKSILEAIKLQERYGYSFWDSLIIQAALEGNVTVLFSEDFTHSHGIAGLRIENPFR